MPLPLAIPIALAGAAALGGAASKAGGVPKATKYHDPYGGQIPGVQPLGWGNKAPNPTTTDVDLSTAGVGENYWAQNQGKWSQPTASSKYWEGVSGRAAQPPQYGLEAYNEFKKMTPADMSGYYDRAESKAMNAVNRNMASQGMLGSKYANDATSRAILDLRSQEARDSADYGMKRAALGGQLASGAQSGDLNWLIGMGGLANQADAADLSRLNSGFDAASNAQRMNFDRGMAALAAQMGLDSADAALIDRLGTAMLTGDRAMLDQIVSGGTAAATTAANNAANNYASTMNDMASAFSTGIGAYNAGMLGGRPAALQDAQLGYLNRMGPK